MMKKNEVQKSKKTEPLDAYISEIRAEKVLFCHPPEQWHFEAKVSVYQEDKPKETVYISICGWEPDMVQITRNSIFSPEAGANPEYDIGVIEDYDTMKGARKSCYWKAIKAVSKLFNEVCSL